MPIPQDCQSPIEIYVGGGCVGVRGGFQQMVSISNCITAQTKYIQSEITDAQQKCHQRRNLSTAKSNYWANELTDLNDGVNYTIPNSKYTSVTKTKYVNLKLFDFFSDGMRNIPK